MCCHSLSIEWKSPNKNDNRRDFKWILVRSCLVMTRIGKSPKNENLRCQISGVEITIGQCHDRQINGSHYCGVWSEKTRWKPFQLSLPFKGCHMLLTKSARDLSRKNERVQFQFPQLSFVMRSNLWTNQRYESNVSLSGYKLGLVLQVLYHFKTPPPSTFPVAALLFDFKWCIH